MLCIQVYLALLQALTAELSECYGTLVPLPFLPLLSSEEEPKPRPMSDIQIEDLEEEPRPVQKTRSLSTGEHYIAFSIGI